MVDIILTLALVALTVVSLLYIGGCDRLQTGETQALTSESSAAPGPRG